MSRRVGGIILCGGESKRMGQPKAWLPFAGEYMLPRIVRLVRETIKSVVVVAGPHQALPPLPADIAVVRDEIAGRGPLQGLSAGLHALSGDFDAVFVTGCDAPLLRPAFIRRLNDLLGDASICVPHIDGFQHPLAAVYRVSLVDTVDRLLAANCRRLLDVIEASPSRRVSAEELRDVDPNLESLRNLNTREDYERALAVDQKSMTALDLARETKAAAKPPHST